MQWEGGEFISPLELQYWKFWKYIFYEHPYFPIQVLYLDGASALQMLTTGTGLYNRISKDNISKLLKELPLSKNYTTVKKERAYLSSTKSRCILY